MSTDGPETNDPLSPYFPAEVPAVPANGRAWVALFLALTLFAGAAVGLLALVPG